MHENREFFCSIMKVLCCLSGGVLPNFFFIHSQKAADKQNSLKINKYPFSFHEISLIQTCRHGMKKTEVSNKNFHFFFIRKKKIIFLDEERNHLTELNDKWMKSILVVVSCVSLKGICVWSKETRKRQ